LWAAEGWRRLKPRGRFEQPESGAGLVADLEATASPLAQFLEECCGVGPEQFVAKSDLYEAWHHWCQANGHTFDRTLAQFGADLRSLVQGLKTEQRRTPEGRIRIYRGVGLLAEERVSAVR
jgi:phage/plasmid-associated DNA primase